MTVIRRAALPPVSNAGLADRELADIGIERPDIPRTAWEGRDRRECLRGRSIFASS